jgi:hypothetical protein
LWIQELLNSYATDARAQELLAQLAVHSPDAHGYSLDKGLIRYKYRLWIADNTALQSKLITAMHDSAVGGHLDGRATYQQMKGLYYWPGMKRHIEEWIKQCIVCQQAKHEHTSPAGLLQPLPVPERPWVAITMDFIEGLPKSDGCDVILVVVDRLTKYAHFLPLRHPFTATTVANLFMDSIIKLHGAFVHCFRPR